MSEYKMPERQPNDGAVSVSRPSIGADEIWISVENGNHTSTLRMSPYNAWRVLGLLSCMLGLPLVKAAAKASGADLSGKPFESAMKKIAEDAAKKRNRSRPR